LLLFVIAAGPRRKVGDAHCHFGSNAPRRIVLKNPMNKY
jgi:hypothetical protein